MPDGVPTTWRFSELFSPGMILLLVGLAGYVVGDSPLESRRPESSPYTVPQPPHPDSVPAIHGRLWEDSLAATYRDWNESKRQGEYSKKLPSVPVETARKVLEGVLSSGEKVLVMPVLVPGGPYGDDSETRRRMRYSLLSALSLCGYQLSFPQRLSYTLVPVGVDLIAVNRHLKKELLVPIKLFRRNRSLSNQKGRPYEFVFVLWINELQLEDRPLAVIGQVVEQLFGTVQNEKTGDSVRAPSGDKKPAPESKVAGECAAPTKVSVYPEIRIIGPSSSDMLLTIARESKNWKAWQKREPKIFPPGKVYRHVIGCEYFKNYRTRLYSPRATISGGQEDEDSDWLAMEGKTFYDYLITRNQVFDSGIQKVVRTIGTDAMLVKAIKEELRLRGKWADKATLDDVPVVLVTEQDTLYGREFPKVIERELKKAISSKVKVKAFKYLRGIDGKLPGTGNDQPSTKKDNSSNSSVRIPENADSAGEQTNGRSQVDYLRRLESELVALDAKLRRDGRRGILAIGVVGTDVYDKLLILRALRKRFPNVCFFTTDLDAGLADQGEYRYARNLIVASHFGLRLDRRLQREIPPFRDSYQTSLFFATMLALKNKDVEAAILENGGSIIDPWGVSVVDPDLQGDDNHPTSVPLKPLMFEIGRNGPYQLTMTGSAERKSVVAAIHPQSPREYSWLTFWRLFKVVCSTAALLLCLFAFVSPVRRVMVGTWSRISQSKTATPWNRRWWMTAGMILGILLIVVGPLTVIWGNHHSIDGEPFAWNEGISLWPPTLVRYVVFLSAIVLFVKGHTELAKNLERLRRKYAGSVYDVSKDGSRPLLFRWSVVGPAIVSACRFLKPALDEEINIKLPDGRAWADDRLPIHRTWRSYLFPWRWHMDRDGRNAAKLDPETLFAEYYRRELPTIRLARVLRLSASFLAFGVILLWVTRFPTRPYRGPWADWSSLIVLILAVVFMVVLTFFVLDRLQLCRRFIHLLYPSLPKWDSEYISELQRDWNADLTSARQLCTIRLIAEHTNTVMKLLYYPFILVLLMLVARLPAFDYMNLPIALIAIFVVLLAALIWGAYDVRKTAQDARNAILSRMRNMLLRNSRHESKSKGNEQIRLMIAEAEREHRGAFGPIVRDPIFGSLALVFGGSGGLLLLQRFLPSVIF